MSDDQLISIEENGDYWLSKSNNEYHIINPNATKLTTIEANTNGYYSLARGGDTFYVLDSSGNSIKLNLNGRTMFNDFTGVVSQTGSTHTYTPTHVEESPFVWYYQDKIKEPHITPPDAAFLVLASRNDVTPNWDSNPFVNYNIWGFFFDETGAYHGQTDNILHPHVPGLIHQRPGSQYESLFGFDPDVNGITPGASPTDLLDISGNQHHIDDGYGGDSIILKRDNVTIDPNSNGGLNATQVQKNGNHYELLLEHENVKYDVWKVDTSGNLVSSIKAKLWEDEQKFNLDLNGDGDTGLQLVEAIGNVHLKHGDNTYNGAPQYYIVDGNNDPIGLTNAGASSGPASVVGWSATQVIANESEGYEVLWTNPSSNKYDVWKVDTSGNLVSSIKAKLWEDEQKFNLDLNGDGSGAGKNNIYGVGNDNIFGSIGHDTFDGGDGNDSINGWKGHDTLIGGDGDDTITGDGGSGYAGNDILFGNAGNDDLLGRGGNDQIDGGTGSDTITTGPGLDKIILRIGDGGNTLSDADIITDFTDGSDKLRLDGGLLFSQLVIAQGSGVYANDTIISKGSEEYLAILQGINASSLSDDYYETVDIA